MQGVFKQTVQLASGKFALVENAHEFTLVPWRPVIENRLGREVMGVVQGGSVSCSSGETGAWGFDQENAPDNVMTRQAEAC